MDKSLDSPFKCLKVLLEGLCLNCFSDAVVKWIKAPPKRKHLILSSWLQRVRIHDN